MEGANTNSLRAMAPKWSLAGDDQLLDLLKKTHQTIISKCQDVDSKLEEMALQLDDASIHLQNVNNRFMALSNSQFIESRVYDDDDFTEDATPVRITSEPSAIDEISTLKASLLVLERVHETAVILDESDSDSDAEVSVVLKPKDMYSERPLPYIIGSQSWKNKWHGGLIVEDSDTDSYTSKQGGEVEQYSESESEDNARPPFEENTLSESSTSLPGSVGIPAPPAAPPLGTAARPADIAAALARRLGTTDSIVQEEPEEYTPPAHAQVARKLYIPDQPATSTIFADEPPPLDYEPDTQFSDEDIFAEINKHTPYTQKNTMASIVTEDLFSFAKPPEEQGDIFSDFAPVHAEKPTAKQQSILFEGESEPELFAEPSKKEVIQNNDAEEREAATNTKKPVGGISLFGSNKGTERIGAAILKRNQRKSSTSDDESGNGYVKNQTDAVKKPIVVDKPKITPRNMEKDKSKVKNVIDNKSVLKKEKDIFEDLFPKSESVQNKSLQNIDKKPVTNIMSPAKNNPNVKVKEKTNVKDLFSDNIFDDIDDIFTSSVKIPSKESNQNKKSIFDDDDLFSDIDIAKSTNQSNKDIKTIIKDTIIESDIKTTVKDKKSIFDSNEELFSDTKSDSEISAARNVKSHASKNIIKDDVTYNLSSTTKDIVGKTEINKKPSGTTKERNLFDDSPQVTKPDPKPKDIFDSDSDDDIFAKIKTPADTKSNKSANVSKSIEINEAVEREHILKTEFKKDLLVTNNVVSKDKNLFQSPALFEEDEIDDLFIAANKLKSESSKDNIVKIEPGNTVSSEKEIVSEYVNIINETDTFPEFESTANNEMPKKITKSTKVETKGSDQNTRQDELVSQKPLLKDASENINVIKPFQSISKTSIDESQTEDTKIIQNEINIPTEIQNTLQENEKESIFGNFSDSVDESKGLAAELNIPSSDVFNQIFTEPPAFKKPAESKKNKNVNALFDDDSDDESLFFKKNDGISDEKPEIFSTNANFDIFVNEPPAIDVDFTTKTSTNIVVIENEDDIFNFVPKTENVLQSLKTANDEKNVTPVPEREQNFNKDNEETLFNTIAIKENVSQTTIKDDKDLSLFVPKIEENTPANKPKDTEKNIVKDKSTLSEEIPKSKLLFADIEDEDIFTQETEKITDNITPEKHVSQVLDKGENSDEELFSSLPNLPKYNQIDDQNGEIKMNINNNISDDSDNIFKESPKNEAETKKIGKINTKNFIINVNALMPGASPKKIPKDIDKQISDKEPKMAKSMPDETDFQPKTIVNKTESDVIYRDTLKEDLNTAKSTTLIEKSDSGVLNNNASKQRPKIQVKRRPSTRKARHEAARKSAIDFGDDSDNSSSFDEPKPKIVSKVDNHPKKEEVTNRHTSDGVESTPSDVAKVDTKTKFEEENAGNKKAISKLDNKNVFENTSDKIEALDKDSRKIVLSKENKEESQDLLQNLNESKKTTTKVVYILNDEDIFNTQPKSFEKEDLFESSKKSGNADFFNSTEGVKTLGKTYNEINIKEDFSSETAKEDQNKEEFSTKKVKLLREAKQSLFDDSDDELFNKKKNISKQTTIFDSDSEEDLFTGKKSKEKIHKEQKNKEVKEKKEVVKGSLFGDDDDDDLFGLRKTKTETNPRHLVPSTSREASNAVSTASKTVEPVFSDPLSMLGNDD